MALDESKDTDTTLTLDNFTLTADSELLKSSGGVKVDYSDGPFRKGFIIKSLTQQECGSGCSC
ncbi:MAG: hypothetical protein C0608_06405 [Deltaproteobacteria bacterium]|nr:MAG: hypothetical protein C0608_06405 [Deltaproteobacteria bacterium]